MNESSSLESREFSDLIGAIYDCAVDPAGWTDVLRRISTLLNAFTSAIYLIDLEAFQPRLFSQWGMPEDAVRQWRGEFAGDVAALHARIADRIGTDPDEPQVFSQMFSEEERDGSRVNRDWARQLGVCDVVSAVVSTSPTRVGFLAANRHDSVGLVTPREVEIVRLLAPHVRQAVEIGDLLDMRRLSASSLEATLDSLSAGVVILGAGARILHANAPAKRMLQPGGPLRSADGTLVAASDQSEPTFAEAGQSADGEDGQTAAPLRIVLPPVEPDEQTPAIAHVLPLDTGASRTRLAPHAISAVFVSEGATLDGRLLDALAGAWHLTAAERRILGPIARGLGVNAVADELGLAINTVKTHLVNLFKKAGVSRQADLSALVHRLVPPIAGQARADGGPRRK